MQQDIKEILLANLANAVRSVPADVDDHNAFEHFVAQASGLVGPQFFENVMRATGRVSAGIRSLYIEGLLGSWETEGARAHARILPELLEPYADSGEMAHARVLSAVGRTLQLLARHAAGSVPTRSEAFPIEDVGLAQSLYELSAAVLALGESDLAYDFVAHALDFSDACPPDFIEKLAREGIRLGKAARRVHQVAFCTVALATAVLTLAERDRERRSEAFRICELAIEWLRQCPATQANVGAKLLAKALVRHKDVEVLLAPTALLIDEQERPAEIKDVLPMGRWIPRVVEGTIQERAEDLERQLAVQSWDQAIDNALHLLETTNVQVGASADPITWTIEHPAHRRAVPHMRSFLRELNFDRHIVELAHEITHVLSYLGHLGAAITCLRVANFDNEITMWSFFAEQKTVPEDLLRQVSEGPAPLTPGNASFLFRADLGVELAAKARALQDIWAPWLEGLAVFGETSADPSAETSRINPVAQALRGMIDFHPAEGATLETLKEQFDSYVAEFETRCSKAMRQRGPIRLSNMLRRESEPYFSGYMAVRSVIASWRVTRQAAGKHDLGGSQAFDLLLHATRYSTSQAIPDLSLPSGEFELQARAGMAAWVRGLSSLSATTLDVYFVPIERDERGSSFSWDGFDLVAEDHEDPSNEAKQVRWLRTLLSQAWRSMLTPADETLWRGYADDSSSLATQYSSAHRKEQESTMWSAYMSRMEELTQQFVNVGSMLPIGRADAPFYLVHDIKEAAGHLILQLRTTEARTETHRPSVNIIWQPVSGEAASLISANYAATAEPRVHVTRVIDLQGLSIPGNYQHLLAFHYGDWFEMRGPTGPTDAVLRGEVPHLEALQSLLRMRLHPKAHERMLGEEFFSKDFSLKRTLDWLSESPLWQLNGKQVSVNHWTQNIESKASAALDVDRRRQRRTEAAGDMHRALFPDDPRRTTAIVDLGFNALTEAAPELRGGIVSLLLESARAQTVDIAHTKIAENLRALNIRLFDESEYGWDVSPASLGRAT